jgi:hypothetical protein
MPKQFKIKNPMSKPIEKNRRSEYHLPAAREKFANAHSLSVNY